MATGLRQGALIRTIVAAAVVVVCAPIACRSRLDVGAVRDRLAADSRGAFDLVVALQGLDRGGDPDWGRAEQLCRGLRWPRCDRPALEEMALRSPLPRGAVKKDPASAAARAVADVTWAFGSEYAARRMFRAELDRIPEADGPDRARVFLRFGVIDTNFDGQAALFNQACAADAAICDHLKEATEREVRARVVAPGNVMPIFFAGHPKLAGPPGSK